MVRSASRPSFLFEHDPRVKPGGMLFGKPDSTHRVKARGQASWADLSSCSSKRGSGAMGYAKRMAFGAMLFGIVLNPVFAIAEDEDSFRCNIGPVTKTYGQGQWLVYSCNDDKTLLIVSAPGNPATPYYFTLLPTDAGHRLFGDGAGKKEATAAASEQLKSLSEEDIANVIKETKAPKQ